MIWRRRSAFRTTSICSRRGRARTSLSTTRYRFRARATRSSRAPTQRLRRFTSGCGQTSRARVVKDLVTLVEREKISVLLVTHDLEEALSLSDDVYLLSQGPRAHITEHYEVPLPRPRDPVLSRTHPAFAPLYERLWTDLSRPRGERSGHAGRAREDQRSPGHP